MAAKLLRLQSVIEAVGLQKSAIYGLIRAGDFPAPVRLTDKAVAWRSDDIDRWIESRTKVTAAPLPCTKRLPRAGQTQGL